ncbi:MAG: LON peptidase substrate-binding domain-containing protein [Desulfobacteraceae bacterium]|nr:LON peptidase substrate-binding domain-containing protein [Desulfobacteraceae bacterium]
MNRIPLFPLGVVLLPGMAMPLHIFEERYKQMISECLENDRVFGIVYYDGQDMRGAGCLARVTKVLKRYDDGRMDIVVQGGERFIMRQLLEEKSYMEADVVLFGDEKPPADVNVSRQAARAEKLLRELADEGDVATVLTEAVRSDPEALSFAVAATASFERSEQQRFLEMTSSTERLEKAISALSAIAERSRISDRVRDIIGGNGRLPETLRWLLKE